MHSSRICVGVVFGGVSGEHYVSINSAKTIVKALKSKKNSRRFDVLPIYIDQKGKWWSNEIAEKVLKDLYSPDEECFEKSNHHGFQGLPESTKEVDVWYPALHGPNGEDGTIQGLFKLINKPFVGSGILGSAIGMDKIAMKSAFKAAGLPQVPYKAINANEINEPSSYKKILNILEKELCFPCFVKPANLGSSVGISKVRTTEQLLKGLKNAATFDERIIVEAAVEARELECGLLGKQEMKASVVGEVKFNSDWYDYKTKYSDKGASQVLIPAPIEQSITYKTQQLALEASKAVAAYGIARVDFFYDEINDQLWINEINTLPGFTSQSMYPKLWEATGVCLEDLVAELIDIATE